MKSVMYHYVRKNRIDLPYFAYLHVDDFTKQIEFFRKMYNIISLEEMVWCFDNKKTISNGLILTFDDGFVDHYEFVFPILKKLGLWGLFYVPTQPYEKTKLLDVHRIHYLLGRYGGEYIYNLINKLLVTSNFISGNKFKYSDQTYIHQDNDQFTSEVKKIFNYYLQADKKTMILDDLMHHLCEDEVALFKSFYLSKENMLEMIEGGMSIASHAHTHTLLSNLSKEQQCNEIQSSIEILRQYTKNQSINSFCYPYGGKLSYNSDTLSCLEDNNVGFAFSVESRDINEVDLTKKYEIPRYDCNEFKFGQVTRGSQIKEI